MMIERSKRSVSSLAVSSLICAILVGLGGVVHGPGPNPGQCISQWDVLSLYKLDFGVVFLNPEQHSCNSWWGCREVFLENCLKRLVVCLNSDASSIYIIVELLKTMYYS